MDDVEIRVHPMAAAYMTTLSNCIEAATPMVRLGLSYSECESAIRTAAIELFEMTGMPDRCVDMFMSVARTAFKILEKKKRGSTNDM